jgi:FMN phosphatase YigB (HAD superfamily)
MKENEPKIALFDLDGSLAGFHETLMTDLQKLQSPNDPPITHDLWSLEDQYPFMKARMKMIRKVPGWWANLSKIEEGFSVLKIAKDIGFKNHILTKGPKTNAIAWKEKIEWCAENVGDLADSVNIVSDKGLFYGVFLYDDYPDYMLAWLKNRPRGLGIMPETPYNKEFKHPQVVKYNGKNLDQVVDCMHIAYNRKSNEQLILP